MTGLLAALGLKPPRGLPSADRSGSPANTDSEGRLAKALSQWRESTSGIVNTLQPYAARAAQSRHKDAKAAFIEIQSVIKALGRSPRTLQEVQEFERWLREDDVVADVDDLACKLRVPLLAHLALIRDSLNP